MSTATTSRTGQADVQQESAGGVGVVAALDAVACFRPTRRRFAVWARQEPELAGLSWHSLQRELLNRDTSPDRKDDLLASLLRLARSEPDAVTALVVCLSPGLRAEARPLVGYLEEDEAWAVVHLGLCERIATYDLERRPRRIAVNLIRDAIRPLRRAVRREARYAAHHRHLNGQGPEQVAVTIELSAKTILTLAQQAGVLAPVDRALIDATRLGGLSLKDAAALLGQNGEAAKKRRQRAEPRLVNWWLDPEHHHTTAAQADNRGATVSTSPPTATPTEERLLPDPCRLVRLEGR